jgi:hypothetical protein
MVRLSGSFIVTSAGRLSSKETRLVWHEEVAVVGIKEVAGHGHSEAVVPTNSGPMHCSPSDGEPIHHREICFDVPSCL